MRTLAQELARDHDVTVLALRWPDQLDEEGGPPGVDLRTIPAPSEAPGRLWDRVDAVMRSRPVGWDRLVRRVGAALPAVLAEHDIDVVHVVPDDLAGLAPLLDGLPSEADELFQLQIRYLIDGLARDVAAEGAP